MRSCKKLVRYAAVETRYPGQTSSVTAQPPTNPRRSSTRTLRPARARYAAATSPLWPPPTTTASYFIGLVGQPILAAAAFQAAPSLRRPRKERLLRQKLRCARG